MSTREGYSNTSNSNTKNAIGELLRSGASGDVALSKLKSKFTDAEIVSEAFGEYEKILDKISSKANKFASKILTKYSDLSAKELMQKALKYKKKYNFTDDEFSAFTRIALATDTFSKQNQQGFNMPNTVLARTFGYTSGQTSKMNYKPADLVHIQEILRLTAENSALHQNVYLQSLAYNSLNHLVKNAQFDKNKTNFYNYVHPIVVSLFAPKINYIEQQMIHANIGNIVQSRYNGTPIKTWPDNNLYYAMISDPNELTCSSENPLEDLKNRVVFQTELWKAVIELRQGRYHIANSSAFLGALSNCRSSTFDAPDMVLSRDEGAMMRRFMGVFSLRPTLISSQIQNTTSSSYTVSGYGRQMVGETFVTVPMINFKLPSVNSAVPGTLNLSDAFNQPDWFIENKTIVMKTKTVYTSNQILVFYVNRRAVNAMNFAQQNNPMMFSILPVQLSGFEQVNEAVITYYDNVNISATENYTISSFVFLETQSIANQQINPLQNALNIPQQNQQKALITGCSSIVYDYGTVAPNIGGINGQYAYQPNKLTNSTSSTTILRQITNLAGVKDKYEKFGTVYVYVKA
jgi:hypothetical protein